MKKIASILILVFAFTVTAQAQKKGKDNKQGPKFTVEQHTALAVKKMTLKLDLTDKQQDQIKPLINAQAAAKKAAMESRKENREAGKKPTSDEIFEMKSKQLDSQIAFKNKMKNILTKEQFEKFEKMMKNRKGKKQKGENKKGEGKKGEGKRDKNKENR
ncbi:MAG: Spy/CpxP family protein refolding chaperone [Polaribacter sp.]|nr:Spy/CpxP family protein refolding chaperone [Polaribacter sp.]